ncbi:MAG: hypothetical protein AB7J30_12620 [Hyphomicrobium sp.]
MIPTDPSVQILPPSTTTRRTRVAGGREVLRGISGRTWAGRRWLELYVDFVRELTGGESEATAIEAQLAKRAASLALAAELLEAKIAGGDLSEATIGAHRQTTRALSALSRDLRPRRSKLPPKVAAILGRAGA